MENQQILMKEKLGFIGILKQSFKIFSDHPKFFVLAFLLSLPLFFSMFLHETTLQQTFIEAIRILIKEENNFMEPFDTGYGLVRASNPWTDELDLLQELALQVSPRFLICGLLYLGTVHILDVLNAIVASGSSSDLYAQKGFLSLKQMLVGTIRRVGFLGPFATSIYVLILVSLTSVGLVTLATNMYLASSSTLFVLIFGSFFIALLTKHVEWSAIWNMGLMVSILEEKHRDIAIGVSAYISRGNRKQGFCLMLVFLLWRVVGRLLCLYMCWFKKGCATAIMVTTGIGCAMKIIKWVTFMVYFYDCKKRFLEKKIDVEEGKAADTSA